ncbi:PspC domain-containing protein, partial [Actinotalea sp. C106]|uniref:PspC domain-containing protein n=1 Tax=Actinotalea sp. C106 TaxID=2908644 RepID=UPI0020295F15
MRGQDRWVGGVASGVALRLGIDALVVRGVLAVSVLLGGLGLVLYGLAWVLLPEQHDGRIHLQQLFRGDFDVAVLGALGVFIAGLSFPERWYPGLWWWGGGGWGGLLWLLAVAVVVVLVISSYRDRQGGGPRPSGPTTSLPRTPVPPPPSPEGPTMTTPTSSYAAPGATGGYTGSAGGYTGSAGGYAGSAPAPGASGGYGGYGGAPTGPPPVP